MYLYPPVLRDVLQPYTQLIVRFEFQLSLEWRFGDGSDKLSLLEGSHFLLSRICSGLFLFYYPYLLPELFLY